MKKILVTLLLGLVLINGCIDSNVYKQPKTKEGAEATAEKYAREFEQKDFSGLYNMLTPELQSKKSKIEFIEIIRTDYIEQDTSAITRLDKVSMESEDIAYAYYTVSSSIYETKAPAVKLEYIKNAWRVNAFETYFLMTLVEKRYFDNLKIIEEKQTKLLQDVEYITRLYGSYDNYCPKAKRGYEDAKQNYEELLALSTPPTYEEYHAKYLITYENLYKYFEEIHKSCSGYYGSRQDHIDLSKKYLKIATSNLEKVDEMTKKLNEKYKITT